MLVKENRLTKRKEFGYIYKKGRSVYSKHLMLVYVPTKLKNIRVGFSVSKKVGVAVVRNRTKRRLRECVRPLLPQMRNGLYVFVARPSIAERPFADVQKQVLQLLRKLDTQPKKRPTK